MPDYGREWSEANFSRLTRELVEAVEEYQSHNREVPHGARGPYYKILNISRALAMHLGNLNSLDYQDFVRSR